MSGFLGSSKNENDTDTSLDPTLDSDYDYIANSVDRISSGEMFSLSREFRVLHSEVLNLIGVCLTKVEALDLFSSNEDVEDVSSYELKYMNLNYYAAKLIEKTPIDFAKTSVDARISIGHLAARKYIEYLSLLADYKLVGSKQVESILSSMLPHGQRGPFNLTAVLRSRKDRRTKVELHRQIFKITQSFDEAKERWVSGGMKDEDSLRHLELTRLSFHRAQAWEAVHSIVDEINVLSAAASGFSFAPLQERTTPYVSSSYLAKTVLEHLSKKEGRNFADLKKDWDKTQRKDLSSLSVKVEEPVDGKLTGPNGEVQKPFIITSGTADAKRKEAMGNVFGTGQKLPTVSIEELVEQELSNRVKSGDRRPRHEDADLRLELENEAHRQADEDRDDVADALTLKARNWDDFTDSVAKGSGNTLNLG